MPWSPPSTWRPLATFLYAVAGLYVVWFLRCFFWFDKLERDAAGGDPVAVERFNRAIGGFPNAFYAKMLGKFKRRSPQGRGTSGDSAAVRAPHE